MLNLDERTLLYGQLSDNVNYTRLLLSNFLIAESDEEIYKKIPTVMWTYTQSIIINLAKIFSKSKNEHYRLEKFKKLNNGNISRRIDCLCSDHEALINKIMNNRDMLFAHTDKDFNKLLFSKEEVERMEMKFDAKYEKLLATTKEYERFTPTDIKNEKDNIENILYELDAIWNEALANDPELGQ